MFSTFADWLERNSLPCFYKKFLCVECPGCGMQRAFVELLRGNLIESIKTYPALLPTLFMVLFLLFHLVFKFRKGAEVLKISFIFTASIIAINFIVKLIIH
jgi:glucan phosphoethanolaminetransferase (alkaline phosphatase superfamily)